MKKSCAKCLWNEKKVVHLHPQTSKNILVPWMSGLVSGLQNRPQQFESARHLHQNQQTSSQVHCGEVFSFTPGKD